MDSLNLNRFQRPDTVRLAVQLEALMVASNLRGMETVRNGGYRGYLLSAVETLLRHRERVAVVSGFPVNGRFETDGPAGAVAMAQALKELGSEVALLGPRDYTEALAASLPSGTVGGESLVPHIHPINPATAETELPEFVQSFCPTLVVFIEVPGADSEGRYLNMRFEDISGETVPWEALLPLISCPTIAIADGGNELGMGKVRAQVQDLPVSCAAATTDELVIADVSNWGAYGLVALASVCTGRPLLDNFYLQQCLQSLVAAGMVDGVTGSAVATEDGLPLVQSESFLRGVAGLVVPYFTQVSRTPFGTSSVSQTELA